MTDPMGFAEIAELAAFVRSLLEQPHVGFTASQRCRAEGALVALELALGERTSLLDILSGAAVP